MFKNAAVVATFALLLAFVTQSCNVTSTSINDTWKVTKIELATNDRESEEIYQDGFLSFYKDDVASFFNKNEREGSVNPIYRIGQWKKDGDELTLRLQRTQVDITFGIIELSEGWLVLQIIDGPAETLGTTLKCQRSNQYRSNEFDLLSPDNNQWRAKPKHKENAAQIQKRVANHVKFLIDYFTMIEAKSQSYFEPGALQTPFRFYSNGMGLANEFETDNAWLSNFYDEEDAARGAKMLTQGLSSIDKYPGGEENFGKSYYKVLVMILEHVEK